MRGGPRRSGALQSAPEISGIGTLAVGRRVGRGSRGDAKSRRPMATAARLVPPAGIALGEDTPEGAVHLVGPGQIEPGLPVTKVEGQFAEEHEATPGWRRG